MKGKLGVQGYFSHRGRSRPDVLSSEGRSKTTDALRGGRKKKQERAHIRTPPGRVRASINYGTDMRLKTGKTGKGRASAIKGKII